MGAARGAGLAAALASLVPATAFASEAAPASGSLAPSAVAGLGTGEPDGAGTRPSGSLAVTIESDAESGPGEDDAAAAPNDAAISLGGLYGDLGAQVFWVTDKVFAGPNAFIGRWWGLGLETSLIYSTKPAPEIDESFVGSQFGLYLELAPVQSRVFEVRAGLGSDIYYLWGINLDLWEGAMSVKASARWWPTEHVSLAASVRTYPIASSGVELGTFRDHREVLPLLFTTGVEWRAW